jgi:hypothetical protein
VDYFELGVFVEVLQASCDSVYDLVPLSPVELFSFLGVYTSLISSESQGGQCMQR